MADSGGRAHHNVKMAVTVEDPRAEATGHALQQPPHVFVTSPSPSETPPLADSGHLPPANTNGTHPDNSKSVSLPKTPTKATTKAPRSDEYHYSPGAVTPSSAKDAADEDSRPKGAQNGQVEVQPRPSLSATPARSSSTIDPLSQHIVLRTNTDRTISSRLRNQTVRPDNPSTSEGLRSSGDGQLRPPNSDAPEKKKTRVSFLSRLSMRGSKKKGDRDDDDNGSELSDQRPDGNNARVFSTVGAGGFIPHHKEPPRYIRTKAHNKKNREFDRMFLAQELIGTKPPKDSGGLNSATVDAAKTPFVTVSSADGIGRTVAKTGGAIWATEFSRDGRFLAAAGRDMVVRVWAVISTHEERRAHEDDEEATHGAAGGERLSAPVFREKPVREFEGHTGEILDLSWSKNNFLLSTSMDRTVRLWHVSRRECLCSFRHSEFVSKVAFHPRDDRFFLAGCLDATLRLWSIPDKAVAYSAQTADLITAVAFSPDGSVAIAGMLSGICNFYETQGLKLQSQLHVRSSRGKNAKGSKITGIQTAELAGSSMGDRVKVLITSTDARVRIYNLRDKTLDVKFKGHDHAVGQLCASFSDDGSYVICPSEDRKTFIWSLGRPPPGAAGSEDGASGGHNGSQTGGGGVDNLKGDKGPCECFSAHAAVVTTAIFAPTRTRQLLGNSGDPVYDLCNPPPVTLVSMGEAEEAAAAAARSPPPSVVSHEAVAHNHSQAALSEAGQTMGSMGKARKAEQSPAYLARSTHYDGNIIVTSDDTGIIKVFRQDCAFRRRTDGFDTASVLSRRTGSLVGRSASILTRTSASSGGPLSRHGSMSTPVPPGSGFVASSDHILSWRRGVESNDRRVGSVSSVTGSPALSERAPRSERSISPSKSNSGSPNANLASERRRELYVNSSPLVPKDRKKDMVLNSPTSSTFSGARISGATSAALLRDRDKHRDRHDQRPDEADTNQSPTEPPTPAFSFVIGDDGNDTDRAAPMAKHGHQSSDAANGVSEEQTPVAEAGPPIKGTKEQAEGGTGLIAATGLWSIKWPRMPNLRMSIGNIPGIGGGGSGKDGGSPGPGGHGRDSSDMNAKGDTDGDVKHKDQDRDTNGHSDKKSRTSLSNAPGDRPGILGGGRRRRKSSPAVTPPLKSVEFALADRADNAAGNGEVPASTPMDPAPKLGPAEASRGDAGAAEGRPPHQQHQRRHSLLPSIPSASRLSMVSRMSSDVASTGSDDDMACRRCGGREFKAKRAGVARQQRFVCAKCGSPAPAQDGTAPASASASPAARKR